MQNVSICSCRPMRTPLAVTARLMCFVVFAIAVSLACPANAAVKVWTGQSLTSGNWSTAANWSPSGAPVAGDALIFPSGVSRKAMTNNLSVGAFLGMGFVDSGYTLRGNSLALSGGIVATQATGGVTIYCDLTLNGDQAFKAYRSAVLGINGTVLGTIDRCISICSLRANSLTCLS
jgi:hypothetical protein